MKITEVIKKDGSKVYRAKKTVVKSIVLMYI